MDLEPHDDVRQEDIEVRVLGPLRVRRADGGLVRPDEWPTAQTADLLRLLALRGGQAVPVDVLVGTLWPHVDERHGRASLRTAASRVRKLLGEDCIHRRHDGLVLTGAWVDAGAFRALAHAARRDMAAGRLADGVAAASEADALYLGDFQAHHDTTEWWRQDGESLGALHRAVLSEAAASASRLRWWRDAIELGERALTVEPCSEAAFRAIMRAQHGLGETAVALKTYDRCRRRLAEEVGADPSTETRELHAELLADDPLEPPEPAFHGMARQLEWLRDLQETVAATSRPSVVVVLGPPGAGKTRLVERALLDVPLETIACHPGLDVHHALAAAVGDGSVGRPTGAAVAAPRARPVAVLLDDVHRLTPTGIDRLLEAVAAVRGPVTVVLSGRMDQQDPLLRRLRSTSHGVTEVLEVPPMGPEEVQAVCTDLLGGPPTEALVTHLVSVTAGRPAAVARQVLEWLDSGRTLATTSGVALRDPGSSTEAAARSRQLLTDAVDRLRPGELDVLQVLAALGRPVGQEVLRPVAALMRPESGGVRLVDALDRMRDMSLLLDGPHGVAPRDSLLSALLLAWMRPSARRRVHHLIAEAAPLPPAERAEHWLRAGEPRLARAASWEVAGTALAEGQYERARVHLRRLAAAADADVTAPTERVDLYERWAAAAARVGRTHEARAAYVAAAAIAEAHGLASQERLEDLVRSVLGSPGTAAYAIGGTTAPDYSGALPGPRHAGVLPLAPGQYAGAPSDVQDAEDAAQLLELARREADAAGDGRRGAKARVTLIREVALPQRRFRTARRWAEQALAMAVDPDMYGEVLVQRWSGGALLGDAAAAEEGLRRAAALVAPERDGRTAAELAALRCLVSHDLGRQDHAGLLASFTAPGVLDAAPHLGWVVVRIATERGDLAAASKADQVHPAGDAPPATRALALCASGALAMELGRADDARAHLARALEVAARTGATLASPEALARMIVLDAGSDLATARQWFEQFEESVGGAALFPRERVLQFLARAAVRAGDQRPDDAAAAAASAADVAETAGLVLLAAWSHRHRAYHLASAGRAAEARLAAAAASRWREAAGTTTTGDRSVDPPVPGGPASSGPGLRSRSW